MAKAKYVLAVDQGTTGTHVSILDDKLRVVGELLPRVHPALPQARLGGARPGGNLGQRRAVHRAGRSRTRGSRARTSPRSASPTSARRPACGCARAASPLQPRDRLAGPAHLGALREAARSRARRPRVRETTGLVLDPYFSGHQARLDAGAREGGAEARREGRAVLRHHRHLARLQADRGPGARHGRLQRQPHAADGPAACCSGTTGMRALLRRAGRAACRRFAARRRCYGTTRGMKSLPDGIPIGGHGGRPAGGALRAGVLLARRVQVHLRHRRLPADEHRRDAGALEGGAAHHGGVADRTARPRTRWRAAPSSPAPRCSGCATG